jgi:phenylacetate-CoA ligase
MKPIEISLIAPCLNEENNVRTLAWRFFTAASVANVSSEVVFIDDGSSDNTWTALQQVAETYRDRVKLIRHPFNQGIPASWNTGVRASSGSFVCLIDSDLQNRPESVFDMYLTLISSRADLVRGIRRPTSTQCWERIFMSRALNAVLGIGFRAWSKDSKSGFVIGSRERVSELIYHSEVFRHFQTFIGVAASRRNFVVVELDTPFDDRRAGTSFLAGKSMKVALEVLADFPAAYREFGYFRNARRENWAK